jgi:heme-degrading monooxygenase HmoA
MIRVMYRWTVKEEDEAEFVRTWEEGTLKIQASCEGAMGSILLRSSENPNIFLEWHAGRAKKYGRWRNELCRFCD